MSSKILAVERVDGLWHLIGERQTIFALSLLPLLLLLSGSAAASTGRVEFCTEMGRNDTKRHSRLTRSFEIRYVRHVADWRESDNYIIHVAVVDALCLTLSPLLLLPLLLLSSPPPLCGGGGGSSGSGGDDGGGGGRALRATPIPSGAKSHCCPRRKRPCRHHCYVLVERWTCADNDASDVCNLSADGLNCALGAVLRQIPRQEGFRLDKLPDGRRANNWLGRPSPAQHSPADSARLDHTEES